MSKVNLKQQIEAFEQGIFLDSDGNDDKRCYNFYDWFCRESSLENKANKLFKEVKRFIKIKNIDTKNVYVFFKNNCPMRGSLYDDFRICDIKTRNVIWTVTPKCGHTNQAEVWGKINDFKEPVIVGKNMSEIYKVSF